MSCLVHRTACQRMNLLSLPTLIGVVFLLLFGGRLAHAQEKMEEQKHPVEQWEVAFEAGYATKIKNNSPWNYAIAPVQIAFRSPYAFDLWRSERGARLAVRNRMSLIGETFLRGPEDYYIGFSGAPSIELWSADQKMAAFFEIGGGAGLTNSKGVPGGQGQNFAFNWYTQLGARVQLNKKLAITGSRYFVHHSNRGMTNPNPGIDVIGYNIGLVWQLGK